MLSIDIYIWCRIRNSRITVNDLGGESLTASQNGLCPMKLVIILILCWTHAAVCCIIDITEDRFFYVNINGDGKDRTWEFFSIRQVS